ncbi:hypothetical protein VTN00DRAFT_2878 [Thermoascus crustaceus]|uniref:uncharacterized protein n=1 Tax=Thermoascus crustaceus TaxID=5088 RepID=UPI0037434B81
MAYVSESTIRAPISKAALHYTAGSSPRSRPKAQNAEANWNRHEQSVPVDSIPRGEKHSSGSNQQRGTSDYSLEYQNSMRKRSPAIGSERSPVDRPKRTRSKKPRKGKTTKSPANGQATHSTEDEPVHGDDSIERASRQRSLSDDVREVTIVGAASPGAKTSNSSPKQSLHRSKTTGSEAMAAAPGGSSTGKMEKTATASKAARKHPGFFSSLFKTPHPAAPEKKYVGNARLTKEVGAVNDGNVAMRNPVRYQEELDRRREQEQQDEAIARRLQLLGIDDDDLTARAANGILELGNAMAYFMNDRFVQTPTGLLVGNGLPTEHKKSRHGAVYIA